MPSVLIVDDLSSIHDVLQAFVEAMGFTTAIATDGAMALERYKQEKYDVVLADIDMKPMDGITLLGRLKRYDPKAVVIIMTAYASMESAIQALKYGAFDYIQKPFRIDELTATIKRGVEFNRFQAEAQDEIALKSRREKIENRLIGRSARMTTVISHVKKLAASRTPVLLLGEPGTGKNEVAEILHRATGVVDTAMVRINCSRGSDSNFRDGLLGRNGEGGAWVKQANGGTLVLQHLEGLAEPMQKELVGVLRNTEHAFRLVCTTSADLERLVDNQKFHAELFYRIASLPLHLPPLRERAEDLPLLIKHFTAQAENPLFDANLIEFTEDAFAVMSGYHWPGNLTELRQVVSEIASLTATPLIASAQLPRRLRDLKR